MNAKTFFSDRVIAYHPILAKVFGSVTSALFLSQLGYWSDKGADPSGWVWKTEAEMTEETGLSRSEQQTAREMLVWAGVLKEKRKGVPARMWFKIDWDMLDIALTEYENERKAQQVAATPQQVVENQQLDVEIPTSIHRVPESTNTSPAAAADATPSHAPPNSFKTWESIGLQLSPYIVERLKEYETDYTALWVDEAIKRAARVNKRNIAYVEGILKRWLAAGEMDGPTARDAPEEQPPRETVRAVDMARVVIR